MAVEVWYSPGEIRFNLDHVIFLLKHSDLLEIGYYPPNPKETGYDRVNIIVRRGKPRAYFVVPVELIAEVKARLLLTRQDGEMLWSKYSLDMTEDEIARQFHCTYKDVISRLNSALWFITGWKRERLSYDNWCNRYRYK